MKMSRDVFAPLGFFTPFPPMSLKTSLNIFIHNPHKMEEHLFLIGRNLYYYRIMHKKSPYRWSEFRTPFTV
jgi:hypothetical protein